MIDFIGDIHGYSDKLEALLKKLGYSKRNGTYFHPERNVLFVGDYIDRGSQIKETLQIVRSMVDTGSAVALMGNHEYNALCYHYELDGKPLREHSNKNKNQHLATINQFKNFEKEFKEAIGWFKTLPLFLETETYKSVHACWDLPSIKFLSEHLKGGKLTDELIYTSVERGSDLYRSIDTILKGKEIRLPKSLTFLDKGGEVRSEARIKWWVDPQKTSYRNFCFGDIKELEETQLDLSERLGSTDYYVEDEKPVFFGHYWLEGNPALFRENICCLDYSVAKGGCLTAYRFNNENKLSKENLIYV
jgi:hypothetical protein